MAGWRHPEVLGFSVPPLPSLPPLLVTLLWRGHKQGVSVAAHWDYSSSVSHYPLSSLSPGLGALWVC